MKNRLKKHKKVWYEGLVLNPSPEKKKPNVQLFCKQLVKFNEILTEFKEWNINWNINWNEILTEFKELLIC